MTISEIVKKYMESNALTQDEFADALNESLRNTNVGRVSISHWLNERHEPSTDFLLLVKTVYQDWRRQFAIDCLCAKLPEIFEQLPDGKLVMLG